MTILSHSVSGTTDSTLEISLFTHSVNDTMTTDPWSDPYSNETTSTPWMNNVTMSVWELEKDSFFILMMSTLVMSAVGVVALIGNSLLLFTMFRPRNIAMLGTPGSLLVASLAIGDLLFGPVMVPSMMVRQWMQITSPIECGLSLFFILGFSTVTAIGYLSITIERYIAICHPFKHHILCSHYKVGMAIAATWLLGFAQALVPVTMGMKEEFDPGVGCSFRYIDVNYLFYFTTLFVTIGSIIIIFAIYFKILLVSLQHRRRIAGIMVTENSNSTATTGVQYVNMDGKSEIEGKVDTNTDIPKDAETGSSQIQQQSASPNSNMKTNMNIALRCLLLIMVHVICQLPVNIADVYQFSVGPVSGIVFFVGVAFRMINTALNPVLYAFSNKLIFKEMKRLLRCG